MKIFLIDTSHPPPPSPHPAFAFLRSSSKNVDQHLCCVDIVSALTVHVVNYKMILQNIKYLVKFM